MQLWPMNWKHLAGKRPERKQEDQVGISQDNQASYAGDLYKDASFGFRIHFECQADRIWL